MRFFKKGPFGRFSPGMSSTLLNRPSTNADLAFREDKDNYFFLQLEGTAGGGIGNQYKSILYKAATNRYSLRVWDPAGVLLATLTVSDGMGSMAALIAGNSNTKSILTGRVIGTIGSDVTFSAGITIGDATSYSGGFG